DLTSRRLNGGDAPRFQHRRLDFYARGNTGEASRDSGNRAQWVDPRLVANIRGWRRFGQARDKFRHCLSLKPLPFSRQVGAEAEPIDVHQADSARHARFELAPATQAATG